jgi:hypothetical protein
MISNCLSYAAIGLMGLTVSDLIQAEMLLDLNNEFISAQTWNTYRVQVPAEATRLEACITWKSDASDQLFLYLRKGCAATFLTYDCLTDTTGFTQGTCSETNPGEGTWHVDVYAYNSGNYGLQVNAPACVESSSGEPSDYMALIAGKPVSASVAQGEMQYYAIATSADTTSLTVSLENMSDDVNLYVKKGSAPKVSSYDCRPYASGTTRECCDFDNPGNALWWVGVQGYRAGSYVLTVTTEQPSEAAPE